MGSSFLFHEGILYSSSESNVWRDHPTPKGTILYSVITPIICSFGICGNTLSLMVLKRKELTGSVYTYLAGSCTLSLQRLLICWSGRAKYKKMSLFHRGALLIRIVLGPFFVLATTDLMTSLLLFFGGLSRGALYHRGWATYDALVGLPLGGAINSLSVLATIGVTVDRVLFLWNPVQCTKPKFCNPTIARKFMTGGLILATLLNIPYCFIFTWTDEGVLTTTDFFDSLFYTVFTWFMLLFFSIIPAIILILGNGFLIYSLKKARKMGAKCKRKRKDHTNLTVTLISIIILFLVSEVPSALVSRTKAVSILFSGNHDGTNSVTLEVFRQMCTLLGAINVTVNFLFYYLFCPTFCRALIRTFRRDTGERKSVQVNVFLLNADGKQGHVIDEKVKAKILEISRRSIGCLKGGALNSEFPSVSDSVENSSSCPRNQCGRKGPRPTEESDYVEVIDGYEIPYYNDPLPKPSAQDASITCKDGKGF